jgi:O-antigen/teichoic acid export membrane protein
MFRSILGVDKFLVGSAYGEEGVAIYTIYAAGVLGVLALLESGVSAWHYPGMVQSIRNSMFGEAKDKFRKFFIQNLISTILLFLGLFLFFPIVAYFLLPKIYFDEIELFFVMSFGVIFYCLTMPFHYVLYGFGRDGYFVFMYAVSFSLMFFWYFFYMVDFGLVGAGFMLTGALLSISIFRIAFSLHLFRKAQLVSGDELL